jgi:Icc-related predicted phosphoesterase
VRIAITSDIHVDKNGPHALAVLASEIASRHADVLVVAGDIATAATTFLQTLVALRPTAPAVLCLAGNQDVWSHPDAVARGIHAWTRLDRILPALCAEAGVHCLDAAPCVIDGVGFVGTLGWYDLSMRDSALAVDDATYRAGRFGGLQWMDAIYAVFPDEVGSPMPAEAVAERLRDRLRAQLQSVVAERVVAVTHHVAFEQQLLRKPNNLGWQFCQAFIGQRALGEIQLADPRVILSISGHTHTPSDQVLLRGAGPPLRAVVSPLGYRGEWRERTLEQAVARAVTLVEL